MAVMSEPKTVPCNPLTSALAQTDIEQQQADLIEWLFADRQLIQARHLISARELSRGQASLLYYWLYMIELAIAASARPGRRWLDQDSEFRLHLAGALLLLTRNYRESCCDVFSQEAQLPLPLSPRSLSTRIRERERRSRSRRTQDALAA